MIYDVHIQLPGLVSRPEEKVVQAAIERDGDIVVVSWGSVMATLGKCREPSFLDSVRDTVGVFGQSQPCDIKGWNMVVTVTSELDKAAVEKRVRDVCGAMFGKAAIVVALGRQAAHDAGAAAADATVGVVTDFTGGFGEQAVKDTTENVLLNPWILGAVAVGLVLLLLVAVGPDAGAAAAAAAARRKREDEKTPAPAPTPPDPPAGERGPEGAHA